MAVISRTSFSTGDLLTAAQWNTQFDTAYNVINGNLDSTNIASSGVASANIASNAVRGSHILTATVTAGHTAGIAAMGGIWGFEYYSTGTAASAITQLIIEPGSIDIQGVRYYLSAQITAVPTGLAASGSYYLYWQAPSSGYGFTASTDLVISNIAPAAISSATAQGLYNGTTQRAFGFFRTRHQTASLMGIRKDRNKTIFANDQNITTSNITTTATSYAVAGLANFFKLIKCVLTANASADITYLYTTFDSASTTTDIYLMEPYSSIYCEGNLQLPVFNGSVRVLTDANYLLIRKFIWTGFDNPW